MLKDKIRKMIISVSAISIVSTVLVGCNYQTTSDVDLVEYEGKEYACVEYPISVFYYTYNGSGFENFAEVDGIYPLDNTQWEIIWNAGDLYCISEKIDEANRYYAAEENYDWYIHFDTEEGDVIELPIEVTEEERDEIYDVENMERDLAVYFDEFEALGSIVKVSKDDMVHGIISIAKYNGKWYWKSEVIDDSETRDDTWPEYIQPLPDSINDKIEQKMR